MLSVLCLLASLGGHAQELNCKVRVMRDKIQNVDPQIFKTMEQALTEFLNTRKWTKDEYGAAEKIDVNFLLNLTARDPDKDNYVATLNIQATRPVFNATYSSPLVNFIDRDVVFHYSPFTPLQFDDNRVAGNDPMTANLTAVLAFYAYIILGLDYESFAPKGGTDFFNKALNIVNNAPEDGKSIPGWKAVEGNRNRFWIIDQILSPRFSEVRNTWYMMHREGLDMLYNKPEEAKLKILSGIPKLNRVQQENPGSILLQFLFNAKSDEFIRIVSSIPKDQRRLYIPMLSAMDVPNAAKYQALTK